MSAAAEVTDVPAPKGNKKKLIILVAALLVVLLLGGAGAVLVIKKKAGASEEGQAPTADQVAKRDPKTPPAYVPLELFIVNLADRETERYAQIGITLELTDAKEIEMVRSFMPAIRNNILMVLAHKTSTELLEIQGKVKLAAQVQRAASRALGVDVPLDLPGDSAGGEESKKAGNKARKKPDVPLPVIAVHFSSFIVQ